MNKTRTINFQGFEIEVSYEMDGNQCLITDVLASKSDQHLDFIRFVNKCEFDYLEELQVWIEVDEASEAIDRRDTFELGEKIYEMQNDK